MDLYFIRHAEASAVGEDGVTSDADRPLTERGHVQAHALAAGLRCHGIHLTTLLTSPLLRAKQTAEDILKSWPPPVTLEVCEELAPGGKAKKLARVLKSLQGDGVALVGHMPDLADQVAWFIGGKKAQIDLAKAGAAHVVCADKPGKASATLVWLITPEWMSAEK